ncbi:hypothetical protein DUI87_11760 [Hirundo rustica rustica]|uniref:Uncharacterized protein n=1 Tax=Hirundo rustica rustica TaxID=333673 RepID=A0A3M0KEM3_HIRRU|nr:hypothetical protein DUI87_11760 [Hirundo rustica rustica]
MRRRRREAAAPDVRSGAGGGCGEGQRDLCFSRGPKQRCPHGQLRLDKKLGLKREEIVSVYKDYSGLNSSKN